MRKHTERDGEEWQHGDTGRIHKSGRQEEEEDVRGVGRTRGGWRDMTEHIARWESIVVHYYCTPVYPNRGGELPERANNRSVSEYKGKIKRAIRPNCEKATPKRCNGTIRKKKR